MRNTRLILIMLLGSGILLLLFIGLFIMAIMRMQPPKETTLDTQPTNINRSIDSTQGAITPGNTVENEESGPADFQPDVNEEQRRNNPDVYIYNRVPFENQYFRIEGTPRPEGAPDFAFIVTLKGEDPEASKSKLTQWLTELGLTSEQITGLLIEFRNG